MVQIRSCSFPLSWQELKRSTLLFFLKALILDIVCWVSTLVDFSCSGSFVVKTQTCPAHLLHDARQSQGPWCQSQPGSRLCPDNIAIGSGEMT